MFTIITFNETYRDDAIFCLLSAKDAIGRVPQLNSDMLDIQKHYFDNNDMFWLAVDSNNRVVGMVGTKTESNTDMWLKRLFIKPSFKRKGIGSALLTTAERYAKSKGILCLHTQFSYDFIEAALFYPSKGFIDETKDSSLHHMIKHL